MKPIERPMPSISYIVARSSPGNVIGCENKLPWHIRTDLKFFKAVTQGHVVIMGRKTFESLGQPLPNRINIVLSRTPIPQTENLFWAESLETALYLGDMISIIKEKTQIIVIGGAQIYLIFKELFTKIYLTEVFCDVQCGDAYFSEKFDLREWDLIESQDYPESEYDEHRFRISTLMKKIKYTRHRNIEDFYVRGEFDRVRSSFSQFRQKFSRSDQLPEEQISLPLMVA